MPKMICTLMINKSGRVFEIRDLRNDRLIAIETSYKAACRFVSFNGWVAA